VISEHRFNGKGSRNRTLYASALPRTVAVAGARTERLHYGITAIQYDERQEANHLLHLTAEAVPL